jgi:cytosine deaminase
MRIHQYHCPIPGSRHVTSSVSESSSHRHWSASSLNGLSDLAGPISTIPINPPHDPSDFNLPYDYTPLIGRCWQWDFVVLSSFVITLCLFPPLPLCAFVPCAFSFRRPIMDPYLQAAIDEARQGLAEGGIPIGSVLVIDNRIVGRGHNRRVQKGSAVLHAEMDCLENAGRLKAADYRRSIIYSTLSPCDMCSGAILLYGIPRVVIGENQTFRGPEDYTASRGVQLDIRNDPTCIQLMREFIQSHPELWNEDIGE